MSLQARDIILSSWEEQMGWFLPDNNNSLWFWLSAMKFVLKMLSWSNKPGARWAYHLSCTTLHQNKFWQILQECVIFRSNKWGISNSKNNGIKLCSMLMDLLQFPLQMHFLMKKKLKSQCHLQEKQMQALSLKPCCNGRYFHTWEKQGKEEQGHCLVQDWLSLLGKSGESPSEGGWILAKGRALNCGAVSCVRCSTPHWNTSAGGISWFLLPF